jgi:hypothetical protein
MERSEVSPFGPYQGKKVSVPSFGVETRHFKEPRRTNCGHMITIILYKNIDRLTCFLYSGD